MHKYDALNNLGLTEILKSFECEEKILEKILFVLGTLGFLVLEF